MILAQLRETVSSSAGGEFTVKLLNTPFFGSKTTIFGERRDRSIC
jgi:hypothetical protein